MQFLGGSPKQAVIVYIEKNHSMKEDEYSKRLETFHRALTDIFGIGTKFIERHIAQNLTEDLEWTLGNKRSGR